jgi:hypothetical protein
MSRPVLARSLLLGCLAAAVALIAGSTSAMAGGGPPRFNNFDFEATYLGCVDDEVDEPGIDGRALVRVRLTNNSPEDVTVDSGAWRLVVGATTVADGTLPGGPADLPIDATWERVVQIPGGTGPALFSISIEVTGAGGTSTFLLEPLLAVPGDCPQPDDATTTTTATAAEQVERVAPRLTG